MSQQGPYSPTSAAPSLPPSIFGDSGPLLPSAPSPAPAAPSVSRQGTGSQPTRIPSGGSSSTASGVAGVLSTSPAPATPAQALQAYKKKDMTKVIVRFKAIGNAPIMKNNDARITAFNKFQAVIQFLRKELGWKPSDALFLYINSSFSPAPDDTVGNLFHCYGIGTGAEAHLIVNYSSTAAWG